MIAVVDFQVTGQAAQRYVDERRAGREATGAVCSIGGCWTARL
jgi:hypothetical protein